MDLYTFLNLAPKTTTLLRLLDGPDGSTTDVACGATEAARDQLIASAQRDPYVDRNVGYVAYKGCYLRPSHDIDPRGWLDGRVPKLTAETATRYVCFMVDVDPPKAGDSATDDELAAARVCAEEILKWISEHLDLSATLTLMSGNGYQIVVRGRMGLDDQWTVAELLMRMKARWPMVDAAGFKPTVGPAVPGTRKCKGKGTPERPHRLVAVEWAQEGDCWATPDVLLAMVQDLPAGGTAVRPRVWGEPTTEWEAVARLPISDVLMSLFDAKVCPVCKSDDKEFEILAENLCCCLHGRRCPAASAGHRGFTAQHAFGYKLFEKWTGFTAAEREEIICAARDAGFDLAFDDELLREQARKTDPEVVRAAAAGLARALTPEPSRHKSIRPHERWVTHGRQMEEVSEHLRSLVLDTYCPEFAKDHNECGDAQPLVFDGATWVYHQGLGIYVTPFRRGTADEDGAVKRIIKDQVKQGIYFTDPSGKTHLFNPSTTELVKNFEKYCGNPGYFTRAPAGLCCRDGFLAIEGNQLVQRPHGPQNKARGRLSINMSDRVGGRVRAAELAFRGILDRYLWNHTQEDRDLIFTALTEQVGAALCQMRASVRLSFFLQGESDTGKSVVARIIRALFDRAGLEVVSAGVGDINANWPPLELATAAANIREEDEGSWQAQDTSRLKMLAEGSEWQLPRKNRDNLACRNQLFSLICINGQIVFNETSDAMMKRYRVIRFPDKRAEVLDDTIEPTFLAQHLDGLALYCVVAAAGLASKKRSHMPEGCALERDSISTMKAGNPVLEWVESECELGVGWTKKWELLGSCCAWLRTHGRDKESKKLSIRPFLAGLRGVTGLQERRLKNDLMLNITVRSLESDGDGDPSKDAL